MTAPAVLDNGALALLASLRLPDGRRWGEVATDDQWSDARAVLDLSGTQTRHVLTRARGHSKTTDVAGIAIAALLRQLTPDYPAYAVAGDKGQALRLRHAIQGFVRRTPELQDEVQVQSDKARAVRTDAELEVLAADGPGMWGLLGGFYVADEIFNWPATVNAQLVWDAVFSSLPKVPGARLVCMSSAGDPAHWTKAAIYDPALTDPRWRVSHLRGPAPWHDPRDLEEQQRRLRPSLYARLYGNEWTASEDRLTTEDDIAACVTLDGPQPARAGVRYVAGLDVGLTNDRTVGCVTHAEPVIALDEYGRREQRGWRVVLDRMKVWQGKRGEPVQLADVAAWLYQVALEYRCSVVFDPYQAEHLAQQLRRRGVPMEQFTFSSASVGQLASTMYTLLREHRLAIPNDPDLIDELANIRLRETSPGVVRMDHDAGKHDDRAISLALSAHHVIAGTRSEQKAQSRPQVVMAGRWAGTTGRR